MTNGQHVPSSAAVGPLSGVRVIEIGVWHAGPATGAIFADLGADVIKVETHAGDPERFFAAFAPMTDTRDIDTDDWTVMFELSNRGKRAISVDLKSVGGREVLERLVSIADVFVTNLRTSTKRHLGIDYESLVPLNPRLIHLNITGFGPEGPLADSGGFDNVGQAISGMMFAAGTPEPQPLNVMVMDQLAAITASHAALAALVARELHGVGQEVHTSLFGAGTWLMYGNLGFTGARDREVSLVGGRTTRTPLRNLYRCSDGKWVMGTNHPEQAHWSTFCSALGVEQLVNDPRFATVEDRHAHLESLYEILDGTFATRTRQDWLPLLADAGLFFAPVNGFADVLDDEQALANGYVADVRHRVMGDVRQPGYPARFGQSTVGPRGPAPTLGEHTREVLSGAGYSEAEVSTLLESVAVREGGTT